MYNPNEPRVQSGPTAGQWTAFDASEAIYRAASDKKGFTEAKTIEEAEERMKTFGVKYVDLKGYGLEHANATLEALENVPSEAIPDAIGNGAAIVNFTNRPIPRKAAEWYGVSIKYPEIYKDGLQVSRDNIWKNIYGINTKQYKTPGAITEKKILFNERWKAEQGGGGEWFFNTKGEMTHYHELGHIYDNKKHKISDSVDWKFESNKWRNDAKYGNLKSNSEAYAEAFADYHGNGGKRLPEYIKKFFKKP